VLLSPFLTQTPARMFAQLGVPQGYAQSWDSLSVFGVLEPGTRVQRGEPLFPRIDVEKELAALAAAHAPAEEAQKPEKPAKEEKQPEARKEEEEFPAKEISIEDFAKIDLRLGLVTACETIEKADKLLKLTVKIGDEERTICSGIRKWYQPEDLIGKTVVVVANLKPRKMRGIISHGMILCASDPDDERLTVITTLAEAEHGWTVS
jgi:methionyl-tRNA synthetase